MPVLTYNISKRRGIIKVQISNFKFRVSHQRPGFTLTEIVIILGIVGIIISAILPLFVNVIAAGRSAAYYSSAYKLADSKIEQYRNTNFDLLAPENMTTSELPNGQVVSEISNEVDGVNETDIKRVELRVSWNYQRPQEVKIVTYIYRGGL